MMCEYKLVKCPTCLSEMSQKNLSEHQQRCTPVLMSSGIYPTTTAYNPSAPPSFHVEIDNLREQFQQYRSAAQSEIQQLRQELRNIQRNYVHLRMHPLILMFCILR